MLDRSALIPASNAFTFRLDSQEHLSPFCLFLFHLCTNMVHGGSKQPYRLQLTEQPYADITIRLLAVFNHITKGIGSSKLAVGNGKESTRQWLSKCCGEATIRLPSCDSGDNLPYNVSLNFLSIHSMSSFGLPATYPACRVAWRAVATLHRCMGSSCCGGYIVRGGMPFAWSGRWPCRFGNNEGW